MRPLFIPQLGLLVVGPMAVVCSPLSLCCETKVLRAEAGALHPVADVLLFEAADLLGNTDRLQSEAGALSVEASHGFPKHVHCRSTQRLCKPKQLDILISCRSGS